MIAPPPFVFTDEFPLKGRKFSDETLVKKGLRADSTTVVYTLRFLGHGDPGGQVDITTAEEQARCVTWAGTKLHIPEPDEFPRSLIMVLPVASLELDTPAAVRGRVILAHLGSGASLAGVREGRCLETTMGFTPASGLVMATRCGDIDPGLVAFLAHSQGMTPERFQRMVNQESGLLGVSETSADLRDLLARREVDVRAAEAVDLFCYRVRTGIGALDAALGGLDSLVFSGGIGENSPEVRRHACEGLEFLGIALDEGRNTSGEPLISADASPTRVRVIRTDEETMIAREAIRLGVPSP